MQIAARRSLRTRICNCPSPPPPSAHRHPVVIVIVVIVAAAAIVAGQRVLAVSFPWLLLPLLRFFARCTRPAIGCGFWPSMSRHSTALGGGLRGRGGGEVANVNVPPNNKMGKRRNIDQATTGGFAFCCHASSSATTTTEQQQQQQQQQLQRLHQGLAHCTFLANPCIDLNSHC
ncbi:hypothetical protein ACLKA7_006360 [Drosophila subpalustris]